MNCESCSSEHAEDYACQNTCVTSVDGLEFSGGPLDFFCPVCNEQNLQVATLKGTQACGCTNCLGFLIDSVSLGIVINMMRVEYKGADDKPVLLNTRELDQTMNCPACYQTMYTHPYHGPGNVILNSCSDCSLNWLDAGELAKIVRAPGRRK